MMNYFMLMNRLSWPAKPWHNLLHFHSSSFTSHSLLIHPSISSSCQSSSNSPSREIMMNYSVVTKTSEHQRVTGQTGGSVKSPKLKG